MSTPPPVPPDQPNIPPVPPAAPAVPPPVYSGVPSFQHAPRPAPYEAPIVPPKSGLGGGTKILLFGCLGIVLLGIVAMIAGGSWFWSKAKEISQNPERFVGETIAKTHPQVEFVSAEAGSKSFTMRDKTTGETLTATLEDVQGGRILLKKSDGTVVELGPQGFKAIDAQGGHMAIGGGEIAPPPDWVPAYPGHASPVMSSQVNTDGAVKGVYAFTTPDPPEEAKSSITKAFMSAGFKLEEVADAPGTNIVKAFLDGERGAKRVVTAMIATNNNSQTQVTLNFDQSLPEK